MITIGTTNFLYGVTDAKPILPEGLQYIEEPQSWLLAKSPDGKHYYVSSTGLFTLRGEKHYADTRETIQL